MEQSLNFEMLRSQWPELAELACMAERYVHSDPESSLVKLRNYTEMMVRWLYRYPDGIHAGVDFKDRTQAAFVVPKENIAAQKYDLSINRYKEVVYQAEEYEDPKVILKRLKDLEKEILADLDELEGML